MSHKSIRLSESKRYDVLESVMVAWAELNPEPKASELQQKIAEHYYNKAYTGEMRTALDNPKLQPFLRTSCSFTVQVEGAMCGFEFDDERPLPYSRRGYPCIYVANKKPKLHEQWEDAVRNHEDWTEQKRTLRREVEELLHTCSSTGQLIEMWPEIEPLLPAYLADPSKGVRLPSIPVSRLNERLGLKTGGSNGK